MVLSRLCSVLLLLCLLVGKHDDLVRLLLFSLSDRCVSFRPVVVVAAAAAAAAAAAIVVGVVGVVVAAVVVAVGLSLRPEERNERTVQQVLFFDVGVRGMMVR